MAERPADVRPGTATRWPSPAIPAEIPDAETARRAKAALEASVLYLHSAHRLARHCERTDHLAEMRREADRLLEADAHAIEAVIRTVLRSLGLPEATELHALEVLSQELRKLADREVA